MRIIAGEFRGRKLRPLRGDRIRPTADRCREAIFNILSTRVQDALVLDLFAGTGALGLEALSRGARSALFLDNHRDSASVVKSNIQTCGVDGRARILRWDVLRNLNCLKSTEPGFDLVFMDPPYGKEMVRPVLTLLLDSGALARDAVIVAEHALSDPTPEALSGPSGRNPRIELEDQRRYGKTLVSFFKHLV
ncbi:MAG: 16S rRNA (guanine(966)-N(2))-methyltransferase RsmD [Desulfobacterales bacterium]|nr:16S rRNA (guanine(966)-N(2))-methyltransferase RsmD [Desulfobacterales bacterium]